MSVMSGMCSAAEPVRDQSQMEAQASALDCAVASLSEMVHRLEERLGLYLREDVKLAGGPLDNEEILVPAAETLRSVRKGIMYNTVRIDSLIRRLEA